MNDMPAMAYVERILPKCTSLLHIKQLQAHLIAIGLFNTYVNRSRLLDFCATSSSGSIHYASFIFNSLPQPSTNDWNAIIRGLAQSHQPINAVISYVSMQRASCKPDALTFSFVLKACARALARMEASQLHPHVVKLGVKADVLLQTTLLDVYAKCGDLACARVVFDEMPVTDVASWNALIAGLAQGNQPNEALIAFKKMKESNLHPNEVTVLGALSACSQLGAFKKGEDIYNYIRSRSLDANVTVCNAVIDTFAKCGFVEKAYMVFNSMECKRDIVTWNTMVMAFAMHGEGTKAVDIFEEMRKSGVVPDPVTFLAVLCACNHAGMVSEGLTLFELMDEIGVEKNMKHYGSTVDLLARAGRLEEAYNIIESMSTMSSDVVLWQTLLGASKTHGNVEMAERASQKLVDVGSNHCGNFVLMSNTYAAHKRWKDVERVRESMRNNKTVKKVPGFSYTEVDGVIYKFINGDQYHPKLKEIHKKLDEIEFKIREYGYMPETNYVLHDIGEEEKENALCYHSEKLAVAFGLISSSNSSSTISVNKNLRICGDCHAMIKLISKIYHREIVIRDRTRFHKFKEGSCSCNDYW